MLSLFEPVGQPLPPLVQLGISHLPQALPSQRSDILHNAVIHHILHGPPPRK